MRRITPLGSLVAGVVAGAVGSAVQDVFFKLTAGVAPKPPEGAFQPPEPEQKSEQATETVARRVVQDLAQQGPLSDDRRQLGGQLVHFAFGGAWGGLYGLARESVPALASPLGVAAFSTGVWILGDDAILPAFRLAAPATEYPARTHAYAIAAHLVYGLAVWGAYEFLRTRPLATAGAVLVTQYRLARRLPAFARPALRPVARGVAAIRAAAPAARVRDAVADLTH